MPDLVLDYHRLKVPIDHPDASVVAAKIADGAVATAKLADLAVTTAKIADLAVTTAKIADGAVTAAKLATLGYATFSSLTADPALAAGRVWFRSDLGLLSYSPDGSTVRRIPYGTINVDAHASRHAAGGADPIPPGGIARSMLEYPTAGVSFAYLAATDKVVWTQRTNSGNVCATRDSFADKSVIACVQTNNWSDLMARVQDASNMYYSEYDLNPATADHKIYKISAGAFTNLAYEAVDLDGKGRGQRVSCSGSTVKSLRYEISTFIDPLSPPTATGTTSATDTAFASGRFGFRFLPGDTNQQGGMSSAFAYLAAPASALPPALLLLETETRGSGAPDDPYAPDLVRNLVETDRVEVPEFLRLERRRYEILRAKGFTDEEMRIVFGYVPQHQVDLGAVTWGAFEFSEKSPTNIIVVTGDNPYKPGAVQRQAEYAKKRGLRVFDPPRNYGEAVALYNKLKSDFPHWLAGKDSIAYQTLGWEELDVFQNVDFYYGELLEHKTHYDQLKRVDPKEIESRLLELKARLEGMKVLPEERGKHLRKVEELLKRGW